MCAAVWPIIIMTLWMIRVQSLDWIHLTPSVSHSFLHLPAVCCLVKLLCYVCRSCMGFSEGHNAFTHSHFKAVCGHIVWYICVCVSVRVCLLLIFITWAACPSSGRVSGVRFWRDVYIRRWGGPSPRLCHTILAKWHTDAGNPARFYGFIHLSFFMIHQW